MALLITGCGGLEPKVRTRETARFIVAWRATALQGVRSIRVVGFDADEDVWFSKVVDKPTDGSSTSTFEEGMDVIRPASAQALVIGYAGTGATGDELGSRAYTVPVPGTVTINGIDPDTD